MSGRGLRRFSMGEKQKILNMHRLGFGNKRIASSINDGCVLKTTPKGVGQFLKRFEKTQQLSKTTKIRRKNSKISPDTANYINEIVKADREISARELQKRLQTDKNIVISTSTINRCRQGLGWISTRTRYCQMVRDANKPKRVEFCRKLLEDNENFDNVIFSDECTVKCERFINKQFRQKGEPMQARMRPKPKHPLSMHIWARISRRGATGIVIFSKIMDSIGYQEILETALLPFIAKEYPHDHRFMQDNDPKHVSASTKQWMMDHGVNHWPTPPESPDLNPIEKLWASLKHHIRRRVKPMSKDELVKGIKDFWANVSVATCNKYIDRIVTDARIVLENNGSPSGH